MAPQIKYGDFMCISLLRYFNAAELTWRFGYCRTQGRWIKLLLRNLKELRTSVKLVEEVKSMIEDKQTNQTRSFTFETTCEA